MGGAWLRRSLGRIVLIGLLANIASIAATAPNSDGQAQSDDFKALSDQVEQLFQVGKYKEATVVAKRYVSLAKKRHGDEHVTYAAAISWLAELYVAQNQAVDAEPLHKRSLAIWEKALGPDHPYVATSLNSLAMLYRHQGRTADAEPLLERALAIREKSIGRDHPHVAISLNNLASLYQHQGRIADAEPLYERALAIREKALGPDHPDVATGLNNLALLHQEQGRTADAEPLYKRSLAIKEKALGPDHPDVATILNNLATLYRHQGNTADAEPLYKRSLAIREKALGLDHPDVATSLNNLALYYSDQGRIADAEPLYKRSLAIREKALGLDHPHVAISLNNLAVLYGNDRNTDAEPLHKRSLAIKEKALGPAHPEVAISLNNLAALYTEQGRTADAEPLYKRSLAIREKALGPDHPNVATSLSNLARAYEDQGRYADAEPLYERALAINEKALGPDHPDVASLLNNLARLYFVQRDWVRAAEFWRRSTSVIIHRAERDTAAVGQAPTGKGKSEAEQHDWYFWGLVKVTHRIAGPSTETFLTAQWARSSEAAASLTQMAARGATRDLKLAAIVRERQDLVAEWQARDGERRAAVSQAPDKRDRTAEAENVARFADIDTRIGDIDKRLAKDFPDYSALASPRPLSIADVQSQVSDGEALVLFLDTPEVKPTPEETFIWAVTKTDSRWVRIDLGTKALTERVAALRCGLDRAAWSGDDGASCQKLLGGSFTGVDAQSQRPLPFDAAKAHELYAALFGGIADLIKNPDGSGKELIVVPSGPLQQLPFHALVTDAPGLDAQASTPFSDVAWLAKRHAVTLLPSVSSLKALRGVAKPSGASRAMIAFANPVLDGDEARAGARLLPALRLRRQATRYRQNCALPQSDEEIKLELAQDIATFSLGTTATIDEVHRWDPVPQTAKLVCDIANGPGFEGSAAFLADSATERRLRELNTSGELAQYRIVHFATHGAIAGDVGGINQPGLILTPPRTATDSEDDGYLTASEITELKLDADWVILSACNTAAGGEKGGEALSGLARAFFYAQARALLVSHWSVYEQAAVKLVTSAVRYQTKDGVGRSEALRRSMMDLIDSGQSQKAHPAYWAPFVVVGEGGAAG